MRSRWFVGMVLSVAAAVVSTACADDEAGLQLFETKVRPILVERCYQCHSNKAERLEASLYLDSRQGMLEGGDSGAVLEPGDPESSLLVEAIGYENVDLQMPPKGKLPDAEIAVLTEWVRLGAPWPKTDAPPAAAKEAFDLQRRKAEHWAWQPIRPVEPPAVQHSDWVRDSLDRFILAKLEEQGLQPAPPADRRTLIRRAYFDLIGLPPTPEEVEAFVQNPSPNAFETVVDHLLTSPHFGERWGRHWLDLVRYAETRGHEFDFSIPNAHFYRDYVLRALNADVPYDQFVLEHVAGDLLPNPRRNPIEDLNESILATGFWYFGEGVHSPVDIRQDEADRVDNQIDVFAKTFLGLTVACARCHDHKFDAISTKDYYSLAGYLHSSSYREVPFQHQEHNRAVIARIQALDKSVRSQVLPAVADARQPVVSRLGDYLLSAREVIRSSAMVAAGGGGPAVDVQAAADQKNVDAELLNRWVEALKLASNDPFDPLHAWAVVAHDVSAETPQRMAELLQPMIDAGKAEQHRATQLAEGASPIVDYGRLGPDHWIFNGTAFEAGPARAGQVILGTSADQPIATIFEQGNAHSGLISRQLPGMVRTPTFTISAPTLWYRLAGSAHVFVVIDSHRLINGPLHGGTKRTVNVGDNWSWQSHDVRNYIGHRAHIEFTPADPASFVSVSSVVQSASAPPDPSRVNALVLKALAEPLPESAVQLAERYQQLFGETAQRLADDKIADDAAATDRARLAEWLVNRLPSAALPESKRETIARQLSDHAAERGRLLSEMKQSPTAVAMLDGTGFDEHVLIRGNHKNLGELAPRQLLEAIAGADQPRPQQGSGRFELAQRMVDPANPFTSRVIVNRIWHHLFGRGIVASVDNFGVLGELPTHPELLDHLADRFIRQGWSQKQLIRQLMLSSTYQMSSKGDGRGDEIDPANKLLHRMRIRRLEGEVIRDQVLAISGRLDRRMYGDPVDVHLTPFMTGRGRPPHSGPLDGDGRRSIYVSIRRNFLPPMMLAFDMPIPFNTIGRRSVSNVPAQALILMNDPFVVEQAKQWAQNVLREAALQSDQRIQRMYAAAFARPATEAEVSAALTFLEQQAAEHGIAPDQRANDLRVWSDLAHVLMNVKEFIFID